MSFFRALGILSSRRTRSWLLLAFLLLGLATTGSKVRLPQVTYRYLFVLDITQSMNVTDAEANYGELTRLAFAKAAVDAALTGLPCGSEAGLGIFTEHRTFVMFTPIEICGHYQALSDMLEKIDWRMAWVARSEVAKGLYSALDAAHQMADDTRLVFLTDGHEAPPVNNSIMPSFRGEPASVAGFIAGIGGQIPSRIPHLDEDGKIVSYWSHGEVMQVDVYSLGRSATQQDEAMAGIDVANIARRIVLGQEHLSSLREVYLQELAVRTHLDYMRIESTEKFLAALRQEKYARRAPALSDLGWIPASLAFACLVYCFAVLPLRDRSVPANTRLPNSI